MFPAERFLRAGASFDEAGAIGAFYGKDTRRFDGMSQGDLRQVIAAWRERPSAEPEPEASPEPGQGDGAPENPAHEPTQAASAADTEAERPRNQSRARRAKE